MTNRNKNDFKRVKRGEIIRIGNINMKKEN